MGLDDTQHVARIVIHPSHPDTVYVARSGTCTRRMKSAVSSRRSMAGKPGPKFFTVDQMLELLI